MGHKRVWRELHEDCRGLEAIEYLLIAALIIIAAICAWYYLGRTMQSDVQTVASAIDNTTSDSIKGGQNASPPGPSPTPPPPPPSPSTPLPEIQPTFKFLPYELIGGHLAMQTTMFSLTQSQLDTIKANNGYVSLQFDVTDMPVGLKASIQFGSQTLNLANGHQEFRISANELLAGSHNFNIVANSPSGGSEKFTLTNFSIMAGK